MGVIREAEARAEFEQWIAPSRIGVDAAKAFIIDHVSSEPVSGRQLVDRWWQECKTPPHYELITRDDHDFIGQCQRAGRYWSSCVEAAQALKELTQDGYIDAENASQRTLTVQQAYTTMIPGSGGTSGAWTIEKFDVPFPERVRKGPFAKPWEPAIQASATAGTTTIADGPITRAAQIRMSAIEDIDRAIARFEDLQIDDATAQEIHIIHYSVLPHLRWARRSLQLRPTDDPPFTDMLAALNEAREAIQDAMEVRESKSMMRSVAEATFAAAISALVNAIAQYRMA